MNDRKSFDEPKSTRRRPAFDASRISNTIKRAFQLAGLNTQSGLMKSVTDTIDHALATAGLSVDSRTAGAPEEIIDLEAREVDRTPPARPSTVPEVNQEAPRRAEHVDRQCAGQFISGSFSNHAGTRNYKLYIPPNVEHTSAPLVVMLHGCQQSADDFAAGTQMNRWADQRGFLVLYPEQAQTANPSRCWNWFRKLHQRRDSGEPSLLAAMTLEVADRYRSNPRQMFVAGLSAGAAMAVILGETYPEVFSAVGAHSGLARGAAHDVKSALGAMNGKAAIRVARSASEASIPTIVFHGDCDPTVNVSNGIAIVSNALGSHAGDSPDPSQEVQSGIAQGGRRFTRSIYMDPQGRPLVEKWIVHDGGHAWSGGSPTGSFTDSNGPDASAEMIRFFLAQTRDSE